MKIIFTLIIVSLSTYIFADENTGQSKPKWELGVGIGGLSIPHYRGSDQRADYIAPIPYFSYSGKRLQVDREGGRFYFYNSEDVLVGYLDIRNEEIEFDISDTGAIDEAAASEEFALDIDATELDIEDEKEQGKDVIGYLKADTGSPDWWLGTFKGLCLECGIWGAKRNQFCQANGSADENGTNKCRHSNEYVIVHDTTVSPPAFTHAG